MTTSQFKGGAVLSLCRTYRYTLTREVNPDARGVCLFIGLNPSTADENQDDPTIRREIGFARAWGFQWLVKVNAYAFRAKNPNVCLLAEDPIGPDNDAWLRALCAGLPFAVAAWGNNLPKSRDSEILGLFRAQGVALHALQITRQGRPKHSLYIRGDAKPFVWSPA